MTQTRKQPKEATELIRSIAKAFLGIGTLETRNSDQLDFSEQAVWQLGAAFKAAYSAGAAGRRKGEGAN